MPSSDSPAPAPWLNTATGRRFNFLDPKPEDIDIVDIAVALSHQARYAGHTRYHYSVAMHSLVIEAALIGAGGVASDRPTRAWGLMHDAAEAYVTDIPWPLKAAGLVPGLSAVEKVIMAAVCARFGLPPDEPPIVKDLDLEILDLEAGDLLNRHPDWPNGTPRAPRPALVTAWQQMRWLVGYAYPPAHIGLRFMIAAFDLGLAADDDVGRFKAVVALRA